MSDLDLINKLFLFTDAVLERIEIKPPSDVTLEFDIWPGNLTQSFYAEYLGDPEPSSDDWAAAKRRYEERIDSVLPGRCITLRFTNVVHFELGKLHVYSPEQLIAAMTTPSPSEQAEVILRSVWSWSLKQGEAPNEALAAHKERFERFDVSLNGGRLIMFFESVTIENLRRP